MNQASTKAFLYNMFTLRNHTAVVIGGGGTLGLAISQCLALAGADVVIANRSDSSTKAELMGGKYIHTDVTDRDSIQSLCDQVGACDILVNCAGTNSPTPFLDISDEEWDKIMTINLNSVRRSCQIFGKKMIDLNRKGSIINIASVSAEIPLSRVFTYSASKAAVLNLTKNLAREWAENGIRVNALSPGFFPAEQNKKVLTEDRVASIMGHTPMKRFGKPEELQGAILLLASNVAGGFITGSNLVVDGGFTCMTI